MNTTTLVHLTATDPEGELVPESFWARPLSGDTYTSVNSLWFMPIGHGDIIRADAERHVTEVLERFDTVHVVIGMNLEAERELPFLCDFWDDVDRMADRFGWDFQRGDDFIAPMQVPPAQMDVHEYVALEDLLIERLGHRRDLVERYGLTDLHITLSVMSCPCTPVSLTVQPCDQHPSRCITFRDLPR